MRRMGFGKNGLEISEIARKFVRWHGVKVQIEKFRKGRKIKEGGIYWASVGQNIGDEIYGKDAGFMRPVLVYKKWSNRLFVAIPLTSRPKLGSWFVPFMHRGKRQTAVLYQIRTLSSKRLYGQIGEIDEDDFARVRDALRRLLW